MKTLSFILCVLFAAPLFGQQSDAAFYVSVSHDTIGPQDYVEVSYIIKNMEANFQTESLDFRDFNIISGPNSRTSMTYINGQVTNEKALSYKIAPKMEGLVFIPNMTIYTTEGSLTNADAWIQVEPGYQIPPQQDPMNGFFGGNFPDMDFPDMRMPDINMDFFNFDSDFFDFPDIQMMMPEWFQEGQLPQQNPGSEGTPPPNKSPEKKYPGKTYGM